MRYLNANGLNLREIIHNSHLFVSGQKLSIKKRNTPDLEILADFDNHFLDLHRVKVKARVIPQESIGRQMPLVDPTNDFFNTFGDQRYCILEAYEKRKEEVNEDDKLVVKSRKGSILKPLRISIPQDFIYDLPYLPSRSSLTLRSLTIDQIKETYKEAMANGLRTILYFPRLGIRYELRENVVEDKMEKTISIRKKIQRGNLTQEHLEPIETFLKRQQVYLSNQQYEVTRI